MTAAPAAQRPAQCSKSATALRLYTVSTAPFTANWLSLRPVSAALC